MAIVIIPGSSVVLFFCQVCGYLPGHRATQPFGHYQIILLGNRGIVCNVHALIFEPARTIGELLAVSGRTSVFGWRTFPDLRLIYG